ncbi:MAG TPA: hypothetical protein VGK67_09725 [Myxococcales bacterium]|jgi:tetratricopeptide (TPR) repeat protein
MTHAFRPLATLLALLSLSLPLAGCPKATGGLGLSPLEDAVRRLGEGQATPHDQALAGFAAYVLESKPEVAAPRFAAAAKAGDPWGLWGQAELARRGLDTRERVKATVRVCEVAPRHPLCSVAARSALLSVGESPGVDAFLEKSALALLAAGVPGDAAFYLRHTAALCRRNRGDLAGAQALWAEAGAVGAASLLGPYSRHHYLEWDTAFPPEKGEAAPGAGPHGPVVPRDARAPDGRLFLSSETSSADVYYWASDFQVLEEGRYQLHALGRGTFRVLIDGALAADHRDFEAFLPEERTVDVVLAPGRHRLVAKVARGNERDDSISLGLARADGKPSRVLFASASGAFAPRAPAFEPAQSAWSDAGSLAAALEEDGGSALASFVAARSAAERDEEGSLSLAEALVARRASAPLLVVRAEATLANHSLPQRVGRGRANRDLEEALKLDPGEASVLQRLSVHARGENRFDEAADYLERARPVAAAGSWRVLLSDMRLAQARGADALAEQIARSAEALEPRLCDALELRYELARRLDSVALADQLVEELSACPGQDARKADHLRMRGDLAGARALFARLADAYPLDAATKQGEAALAMAQEKPLEAAAIYDRLIQAWPRHPLFHKKRAEALDRAGDFPGGRAEREAALALDGSDLKLRRALAIEDGREPLDDLKVDALPLLARYEERHGKERPTTSGVYVLDASAIEAHLDGSFTERTHVLAKVLDQEGVSSLAEVHLPAGAEVLTLRTLKADGRVLEPEDIGGKEGMSLPGVEVGDCVEWEYLASTPSRGAAVPGFVAPKFYFRIADGQLFHSTYSVRAPPALGMAVDAHNLDGPVPQPRQEKGFDAVTVTREEMPTFVREPAAPTADEVLPFVQMGAGAGTLDQMATLGDFLVELSKPNAEVARFAQQAAAGKAGMEAVRAVYEKVMQLIKGPEASLSTRPGLTLAQERGSRLMLLKGALAALKIPTKVVLVRPFQVDPAPYLFGGAELFGYAALKVSLPDAGGEALVAPAVRFMPFARIAPQAEGQDAWILPALGEKPQPFKTGGRREADGKKVVLQLALAADGTLTGKGEETFRGIEAAFLKMQLEKLNEEQRRQALEASIARTFDNGTLTELAIEESEVSGAPVVLRFSFAAPGFAREEGDKLVLRGIYPSNFARRFLHQFERKTTLMMANPERLELSVTLALPPGAALDGPPQSAKIETPFGRFERTERSEPGRFLVEETSTLSLARVTPEQYRTFGEFLIAADRSEQREVVLVKAPAAVAKR